MTEIVKHILGNINWPAVIVASLINFFIGAFWFSKILFAKPWAKEVYGVNDPSEITRTANMGYTMGMAFFMTFVTAVALSVFMYMPAGDIMMGQRMMWGLGCAGLISVIVAANTYKHYLFEQRSFKLVLINAAHDIICFIVMAVIMIYWK